MTNAQIDRMSIALDELGDIVHTLTCLRSDVFDNLLERDQVSEALMAAVEAERVLANVVYDHHYDRT
jgi:hypothetical protein